MSKSIGYRLEDYATSITFDVIPYDCAISTATEGTSITTYQDYGTEIICDAPQEHTLGFDWSNLEFVRTLNNGSFGSVALFRNVMSNELVAVKIMAKTHIINKHQVAHVVNERYILSHINHPFIIRLLATSQDVNHIYIAMRYECGGELFNYMRQYRKLPNDVAKFYAAELLLVIEYLHSLDIVHRDLKLENRKFMQACY